MISREHRLRTGTRILEVIRTGRRFRCSFGVIHTVPTQEPWKLAIVIGTKVHKHAVLRNLARRRVKSAFRQLELDSGDYVVRFTPNGGALPSYAEIQCELARFAATR